jgi:hypothetical protein
MHVKTKIMKNLLTKEQAAEIAFRPLPYSKHIKDMCINEFLGYGQEKFIREFRKSAKLELCAFGPGMFFIRYD